MARCIVMAVESGLLCVFGLGVVALIMVAADHAAVQASAPAVQTEYISAAQLSVEPESARCFPLPPMCSGRAEPVCICGFYAESCKWVCSEMASQ